jgi:hypothetical protein
MSQQKEEKKPLYGLYIMRKDENHISVIESLNYDEVFEAYKKLTVEWGICVKEQRPFSLSAPVVTTFDPGLIYEITVRPIMAEQNVSKYDNPYQQKMMKNGLTNMFGSDMLDGGYK